MQSIINKGECRIQHSPIFHTINTYFIMKKIGRFICFTTLFLLIAGCKQQKSIRYELVDGNPQIDYIDFLNDTLCRFIAPGPLVLTSHYTKKGDIYIIQINDIVSARLYKTEEGKLRGEAPFFEGIWIIKEK